MDLIAVISIVVQAFIAYHIFFLSRRLSDNSKLSHKDSVKQKAEELLSEIWRNKRSSKVYLVNINRYFKDYPSNEEKRFKGYSHIRAEIYSTRFDGIEFFSGMPVEAYEAGGKLSLKGDKKHKVFNVYPVSLVPYEWIEHVDLQGDEYAFVPLFYCKFKGRTNWKFWKKLLFFGYPYKKTTYYKLSDVYQEGNDPVEMKYAPVFDLE